MKTGDSVCMTALDLPPSPKPKKKTDSEKICTFHSFMSYAMRAGTCILLL